MKTLTKKQKPLWRKYQKILNQIKKDHENHFTRTQGHDFLHALIVSGIAAHISNNKKTKEIVYLAGLLHNTDRLFGEQQTPKIIKERLNLIENLKEEDKEKITKAVLTHSQPNSSKDSEETRILKDADRIANLGPDGFMRAGRFHTLLPVFDPRYIGTLTKGSNYKKRSTAYDWIIHALEWSNDPKTKIRTRNSKKIAKPLFEFLKTCLTLTKYKLKIANLLPFPKALAKNTPGSGLVTEPQSERDEVVMENKTRLKKPALILIVGVPGSGKTTLAKELTTKILDISYISKDLIQSSFTKERVAGKDYEAIRIPTQKLLIEFAKTQLQLNKSVIIDAPYSVNAWRKDEYSDFASYYRNVTDKLNTKLLIIRCKAPTEKILKQRIEERNYPWDTWKLKQWEKYIQQEPQEIKINHNLIIDIISNQKVEKLTKTALTFITKNLNDAQSENEN